MNQAVFEKYSVPKAVATMAIPTVLSMLVTIIYNMADTYFVGQTGDANQLAAVSVATPVFTFMMALSNIFGIGGSSFISRALGEGNKERAKHISAFAFYGVILLSIFTAGLILLGMPLILKWIGTDAGTVGYAKEYISILALGAIPMMISFTYGNIVRGEGAARVAMTGMMLGTIVNIILDPIMIVMLNWDVVGAALATVIGNVCASLYYMIYVLRNKNTILSISPKDLKIDGKILGGVFAIGIPASLNNILMSVSNIVMNNLLVIYSSEAVAAMGVAMKANMLVIFVQMGIAMGIQPLIGYSYGARKLDRMKKIMGFAMICNLVIGSLLTLVYFLNSETIVGLFIDNEAVIGYGITMLRALMVSGPFIGIMFIFTFAFQAMGKGKQSLILSASRQGLVFFPVVLIGNMVAGLNGLVYAQPLADIFCLLMSVIMFFHFNKRD